MSQRTTKRLRAHYSVYPHGIEALDLNEVDKIFGIAGEEPPITRSQYAPTTMPRRGLGALFLGPDKVIASRRQTQWRMGQITVVNEAFWSADPRDTFGNRAFAHVDSGNLDGADLTALSAYIAKVAPTTGSPVVVTDYEGSYPDNAESEGSGISTVSQPFDIPDTKTRFEANLERSTVSRSATFAGQVSIHTLISVAKLPASVGRQAEVLRRLHGVDNAIEDELYSLFGTENASELEHVWNAAMQSPDARDASMNVLMMLS